MKPRRLFDMRAMALLPLMVIASAASAFAQSAVAQPATPPSADGRWTPYLGCWRLLAENVRSEGAEVMTVCVRPSSSPSSAVMGVTLTTFADGKRVLEQTIAADGAGHPVSEPGCTGTQTFNWSRDGLRLFTQVQMACNGRPSQMISGLTLFAKGPTWVDIQARNTNGDQQVRVRRYARTADQPEGLEALPESLTARAIADAQSLSTQTMTQEAVMEASAAVSSQAVEAAIVETGSRFDLNSHTLRQLADARVSPNVIDLMVAQSFPAHFRVERPAADAFPTDTVLMPPVLMGGFYGMYDPYAFYNYYYSPFAFHYYYITGGGPPVIIGGGGGGSVIAPGASTERGLVVNGLGYTRVHTGSESGGVAAQPNEHPAGSAPRTVRGPAQGAGADSSGSPSSSGSSGSSSSGGVSSSGGYSNGDAAGSGRTAQPR